VAKIFISYSRKDRQFVDLLVPQIRNIYGEDSYWYDTAIQGGDKWWQVIETQIHACQIFLFLMSDESIKSTYCLDELKIAIQHNKQVLQVLLSTLTVKYEECLPDDLQSKLKIEQHISLCEQFIEQEKVFKDLSRLWGALNRLIDKVRLPLTTTERLLLHNQFEILKQVNPTNPDYHENYFKNAAEILAEGYEWYYTYIVAHIEAKVFPHGNAEEVVNILQMFRDLKFSWEELGETEDIDRVLEFAGFSGNHETSELVFTRFMMNSMGEFEELMPTNKFNSHVPMLPRYRRMLNVWRVCPSKNPLTKEDITRIKAAANDDSSNS